MAQSTNVMVVMNANTKKTEEQQKQLRNSLKAKQKTSKEPAIRHMTGDNAEKVTSTVTSTDKREEEMLPAENTSKIKLRLQDFQIAHEKIKNDIVKTPVVEAKYVGKKHCNVFFKCENLQITGSFKARGACNVLANLTSSEKTRGCVVSSGRNFLHAMTYYGFKQSVPINVVLPKDCPIQDRSRYRENYAIIKIFGNDANDASLHALSYCDVIGSKYVHGTDRLDLIAGYGTVGLELLNQLSQTDAILCPVGSGTLAAGLIIAVKSLKPNCLIYGVECSTSPVMTWSLQEHKPVMVEVKPMIADSLSAVIASANAFHIIRGYMDRMITVDEAWIARAMIMLLEREKLAVEAAGACPVAAIMAGKIPELQGKNVVCILSGGNVNSSRLARIIDRGLAAEGRLVKVTVTLPDVPGALANLLAKVFEIGVDVRSLTPEKTWMKRDIYSISVNMVVETCDTNHSKELEKQLLASYPNTHFVMI